MSQKTSKPAIRQPAPVIFNKVILNRLDNGIPVYSINSGREEILRIEFIFEAGSYYEDLPLQSSTANMMLAEGSKNFSSARLSRMFDHTGSVYSLYSDRDHAGLVIFMLNSQASEVFRLANEMLFNPVYRESELRALMKKRLSWFLVNRNKVNNIAGDHFFEALFGKTHPYGRIITVDDFRKLSSENLKKFHSRHYKPGTLTILAGGRVNDEIMQQLNSVFGSTDAQVRMFKTNELPESGLKEKKKHITMEDSIQTALKIGSRTIEKKHPDYPGLLVLDTLLGGYFGSRLNKNIREEKGLTYGISSSIGSLKYGSYKVISAEVNKKQLALARDEIFREIALLSEKSVGRNEMKVVRNYMLGELIRVFDGPFITAESFRSVWEAGLDMAYYSRLEEKIRTIEPDEIKMLARTYYNQTDLYEITAG
jgi:predicted Zn-dependent peptidase